MSDDVSRQMPGKKDFVSINVDGEKQRIQKWLILLTEYETFCLFKERNPDIKYGCSKFAENRPKYVVLPSSSGTHNVCVCTYHQNPKLMIANSRISTQAEFKEIVGGNVGDTYIGEIKYQHLVARMICNPPREECWINLCEQCEDTGTLEEKLVSIFRAMDTDEITYKQWQSTDRTSLVTITEKTSDFVQSLISKLQVLKQHMFIHHMQAMKFYSVKENLCPGQVLAGPWRFK